MIIGIDGNEANVERKVGISEYAFELLTKFSSSKLKAQSFDPFGRPRAQDTSSKFVIYLKDKPRKDLPVENDNWRYRIVRPGKFWTQLGLPFDLFFHNPKPDVFFSPTHYAPRFSPVPTVVSIMDLSYIHYPGLFRKSDLYQLKNWTKYSVRNASKVLTISKSSKNDIIREYNAPEEKVVVTYPGIKNEARIMKHESGVNVLKNKYGIKVDYILFVGTLQPRKNIERLVEAFSKVNIKNLSLVVVGKKGWLYEGILDSPRKHGVEDEVKFLDFVSDDDLPLFYENAECFVLPSLYEGFGLPVLEAMKYGCPVITSNVSSLPEAGGDAVVYVDPESVDDISEKIEKVIKDDKLKKEMIEKGYKQIKKFSWKKTAQDTLETIREVGKSG